MDWRQFWTIFWAVFWAMAAWSAVSLIGYLLYLRIAFYVLTRAL
jgi:hypothetical protein